MWERRDWKRKASVCSSLALALESDAETRNGCPDSCCLCRVHPEQLDSCWAAYWCSGEYVRVIEKCGEKAISVCTSWLLTLARDGETSSG